MGSKRPLGANAASVILGSLLPFAVRCTEVCNAGFPSLEVAKVEVSFLPSMFMEQLLNHCLKCVVATENRSESGRLGRATILTEIVEWQPRTQNN
jgi:hypothetical protein